MYVNISFRDPNYSKYLSVTGVIFVDDFGIYAYSKGT